MSDVADKIILDNIGEALGGFANDYRAKGRFAGLKFVRAKISLKEIHERVKSRLDGLHGHIDPDLDDETLEALREFEDDAEEDEASAEIDAAIETLQVPTIKELHDKWLPMVIAGWPNAVLTDDTLEMDVDIPPPRKAHAR
jgi:hypothetical protein